MSTDHDISYGWYLKSEDGQRNIEVVCVYLLVSYIACIVSNIYIYTLYRYQ